MAIQDRLGNAGRLGDGGGGGGFVAAFSEKPGGDLNQLFPPLRGFQRLRKCALANVEIQMELRMDTDGRK